MPKSPERCQEIRQEMRNKILHESMLYFAKNGFAGTKISDLSKHIGIAQGTIYVYFESKEELFQEIYSLINNQQDIQEIKSLAYLPIFAKQKIHQLSKTIMKRLEDESYAAKVALNTQVMFEKGNFASQDSIYQSALYKYVAKMIEQGQKEKTVVDGSPMKLADYYWGVVYLYALKRLFTSHYEMITAEDLERILLKDKEKKG
ncbi:TetR/AcrR family transcriptional regulator [Candidatus Stoquefichus massiliensis]|uniref:TetR/AcrR family transcriptional regulator n=1 Tax=Candidatus Stoquefichus massiliensis TaxID=1470350 RepID=UPI000483E908|nr:TetR/AcrR family transcriptional regulator [Candidatus Stoquefichus massiliensis]